MKSYMTPLAALVVLAALCYPPSCANTQKATDAAQVQIDAPKAKANAIIADPAQPEAVKEVARAALAESESLQTRLDAVKADAAVPATPDQAAKAVGDIVSSVLPPPWGTLAAAAIGGAATFITTRRRNQDAVDEARALEEQAKRQAAQFAKAIEEAIAAHPALKTAMLDPTVDATMGKYMDTDTQKAISALRVAA